MRTGLIAFGVIFLVLGLLLYFVPMQQFRADTTSSDGGTVNSWTSSAVLTIPVGWAYASILIGFVLLVFGLAIPNPIKPSNSKKDSYDKVIESRENVESGKGKNKKIVRKRTRKYTLKGAK